MMTTLLRTKELPHIPYPIIFSLSPKQHLNPFPHPPDYKAPISSSSNHSSILFPLSSALPSLRLGTACNSNGFLQLNNGLIGHFQWFLYLYLAISRLIINKNIIIRILIRHLQTNRQLILHLHQFKLPRLLRKFHQRVLTLAQIPQLVHRRSFEYGSHLVPFGILEEVGDGCDFGEGCFEVGEEGFFCGGGVGVSIRWECCQRS
mmetsp:Transcript_19506/g.41144  ORF Transcript_19506/g.41144 Transcript_19506/m.41144 type:complete len:204 (-) Transcript_19506:299-910(-)